MACRYCPRVFKRRQNLINHLRSKHLRRVLPCAACELIFFTTDSLNQLVKTQHGGEFQVTCGGCRCIFTEKRTLVRHLRAKHQGVTFPCPQCSRTFTQRHHLSSHVKTHAPEALPKTKLPEADPADPPQELLEAMPSAYSQLYTKVWHLIRTQYSLSVPIVKKFNFRFE